jgi:hypothetical protein
MESNILVRALIAPKSFQDKKLKETTQTQTKPIPRATIKWVYDIVNYV